MVAAAILINEKTLRTRLAALVRRKEAVRARYMGGVDFTVVASSPALWKQVTEHATMRIQYPPPIFPTRFYKPWKLSFEKLAVLLKVLFALPM